MQDTVPMLCGRLTQALQELEVEGTVTVVPIVKMRKLRPREQKLPVSQAVSRKVRISTKVNDWTSPPPFLGGESKKATLCQPATATQPPESSSHLRPSRQKSLEKTSRKETHTPHAMLIYTFTGGRNYLFTFMVFFFKYVFHSNISSYFL